MTTARTDDAGLLGDISAMIALAQEGDAARKHQRELEHSAALRLDAILKFQAEEFAPEWQAELAIDREQRIMATYRDCMKYCKEKGLAIGEPLSDVAIAAYLQTLPPGRVAAALRDLENKVRTDLNDPTFSHIVRAVTRRARETIRAKAPKPSKKEVGNG